MEGASQQAARRFGWVPQEPLTTPPHHFNADSSATIFQDDAELMNPWAETAVLAPGEQDLAYWVPFSNDLPPTIIKRSRVGAPVLTSPKIKYPMMVALTVATISSGSLLQSLSSPAKAAPAGNDGTGSFQPVDDSQAGDDISAAPTASGGVTHSVVPGDTLKNIAAQYGVDLFTLVTANGIANPDLIYPGDQIYVPGNATYAESMTTYTVQPGDTLRGIATAHGVTHTAIINYEANGITNPDLIFPGQELTIPGGTAVASSQPAAEPQQTQPEPAPEPQSNPAPQPQPEPEPQAQPAPAPEPQTQAAAPASSSVGQQIVDLAMQFQGSPYVWGATGPNSFDCSGFTYYIVNQVTGGGFPRAMEGQAVSGVSVSSDNLQPGDIVFQQNTYKAGMSHVGIYIGGGQFINAANPGVGVTISNLWDSYWGPRYHSAVRIQ